MLDIVAVIESVKPACLVSVDNIESQLYSALINRALEKELKIIYKESVIVANNQKTLDAIVKLFDCYSDKPLDDNFHRELGRLLGYPEETIDVFINNPEYYESVTERKDAENQWK